MPGAMGAPRSCRLCRSPRSAAARAHAALPLSAALRERMKLEAAGSGMGSGYQPHQRLDAVLGEGGRLRGDALDAPALDHVAGPHPVGFARRLRDDERMLLARGDDDPLELELPRAGVRLGGRGFLRCRGRRAAPQKDQRRPARTMWSVERPMPSENLYSRWASS